MTLRGYLKQLAFIALELADRPELLPIFVAIICLVPVTVAELRRAEMQRRIAA